MNGDFIKKTLGASYKAPVSTTEKKSILSRLKLKEEPAERREEVKEII